MTKTNKQKLPALDNSGKVKNPDLSTIGENNYTSTVLKYANLALLFPQLETNAKRVVPAINELYDNRVIANPPIPGGDCEITSEDGTIILSEDDYIIVADGNGGYADPLNTIKIDGVVYRIVGGGGASALKNLTDVTITSPTDGQALIYDADINKWVNKDGGGGSSTLAGLTDVDLQHPTEGQVLSYNSTDSTWENHSIDYSDISNTPDLAAVATSGSYADLANKPIIPEDLSDLGDVNITSLSDDQVLKYDATSGKWINSTGGGGGGASDLNDLDDVTITSPAENQVLKYNGSQWVNATSPAGATDLDGLTDVTITTPTAGQSLVYNSTSEKWENNAVDYSNIANKPTLATVATSGSYTDLSDTPTIPAAQVNSDWNSSSGVSQILNKPNLATVATSGSYNDLTNKPTIPSAQVQADYGQTDNTKIDYIKNKPNLATVATSGDYTDLVNKPTIPAAQVNSDWNASSGVAQILNKPNLATVATSGSYNDLSNKPTIPAAQVNSDWNAASGVAQILNKPTLATVATTGAYSDLSGTPTLPDELSDMTDVVITSPANNDVLKYDSTSHKWVNGEGGDANYVELTSDQYDQLSPAEKTNGTMYFITDINGDGSQFQPIIYSTGEREIGVWIDGKPLYERVIDLEADTSISYNSWTLTAVSLSGIDRLVLIQGLNSTGTAFYGELLGGNNNDYLQLQTSRNGDSVIVQYLIFRYTKTTDTPGSGTWTPQGVPTHHYSTTEQVVGTWIDGSPVYEKTYTITAPNNGTTANLVDISDLNIDTVIDISGCLKSTNNITYKDDGFKAWIRLKANPLVDNKDYIAMQVTNADYYSQSGILNIQYTKSSS